MALTTLSEVKTLLGITDTASDTRITAYLPIIEDEIIEFCNNDFLDDDGNEAWPTPLKLYASRMVAYHLSSIKDAGLTGESIGNYSYSRAVSSANAGYPEEILKGLSKWKMLDGQRSRARLQFREERGSTANLATVVPVYGYQ
jgi:hypothetical protein